MKRAEPWQKAEVAGPTRALEITKPEVVVALARKAKRPIFIVGHLAAEVEMGEGDLIDQLLRMAEAMKAQVVATGNIIHEFHDRGFEGAVYLPAVDIANRLQDKRWGGLNGAGQYDLAFFVGLPYYMGWVILSSMKHYSRELTTISLDRYYQPHATWSFPNITVEEWHELLKTIVDKLGGGS